MLVRGHVGRPAISVNALRFALLLSIDDNLSHEVFYPVVSAAQDAKNIKRRGYAVRAATWSDSRASGCHLAISTALPE